MINIEKELERIQTRKKELAEVGYNSIGQSRTLYYNNLILDSDLKEFKTLTQMEDMLKYNTAETLNEELYSKYKSELPSTNEITQEQELDIENLESAITYEAEPTQENIEEPHELDIEHLVSEITYKDDDIDIKKELSIIEDQIQDIIKNKQNATGERVIVIAAGDPVLRQDAEKYTKLKRMEYILKNDKLKTNKDEFTSLKKDISQKSTEKLSSDNIENLIEEEKRKIKAKMKALEDSGKLGKLFSKTVEVGEGKVVLMSDYPEYCRLQDLLDILNSKFKSVETSSYNDTRSETSLGKLDKDTFNKIMNYYQAPKEITANSTIEANTKPISDPNIQQNSEQTTEPTHTPTSEPSQDDNQTSNDENLIKVKATKVWNWVKTHKKQIIIAVGVTVLAASVAVMLTQLSAALTAATKATQVTGLISQMYTNGSLWGTASPVAQEILHGGNAVLAQAISSLTGVSNTFNATTGIWSFGAQQLTQFTASSAASASASIAQLSAISKTATALLAGEVSAFGLGMVLPKKTSKEYKSIKKTINAFKENSNMTDEQTNITAQNINNQILMSETLTETEKNILFKKLNKAMTKAKNKKLKAEYDIDGDLNLQDSKDLMLANTAKMRGI